MVWLSWQCTYDDTFPFPAKIFGAKNIKRYRGDEIEINGPAQFPDVSIVTEFKEPMVVGTIITPGEIALIGVFFFIINMNMSEGS